MNVDLFNDTAAASDPSLLTGRLHNARRRREQHQSQRDQCYRARRSGCHDTTMFQLITAARGDCDAGTFFGRGRTIRAPAASPSPSGAASGLGSDDCRIQMDLARQREGPARFFYFDQEGVSPPTLDSHSDNESLNADRSRRLAFARCRAEILTVPLTNVHIRRSRVVGRRAQIAVRGII